MCDSGRVSECSAHSEYQLLMEILIKMQLLSINITHYLQIVGMVGYSAWHGAGASQGVARSHVAI